MADKLKPSLVNGEFYHIADIESIVGRKTGISVVIMLIEGEGAKKTQKTGIMPIHYEHPYTTPERRVYWCDGCAGRISKYTYVCFLRLIDINNL
jgi:hypothetical protein